MDRGTGRLVGTQQSSFNLHSITEWYGMAPGWAFYQPCNSAELSSLPKKKKKKKKKKNTDAKQ